MHAKNLLKIILGSVLLLGSLESFAAPVCESLFMREVRPKDRLSVALKAQTLTLPEMIWQMKIEKKLIYKGDHEYSPGNEFLASNEFDWLATPFDYKQSDVLIAFGTNSAWDIAVNKNVKKLYMMDWSPYPLLGQAYLVSPLLRIARTPEEFIVMLSGRVPSPANGATNLRRAFEAASEFGGQAEWKRTEETQKFLEFLASREDISAFELRFLASYFTSLADGASSSSKGVGPFQNLRSSYMARVLSFYDQRYSPDLTETMHNGVLKLFKLDDVSVMSSQQRFNKLKEIYSGDNVKYAMTSITDGKAYQAVLALEPVSQRFAFSITNIFDCGFYNGLTMKDLGQYLKNVTTAFGGSEGKPVVVFRTMETSPPHKFQRYDLKSVADVDGLRLEETGPASAKQAR